MMVVAQLAVSVVLLTNVGLLVRSLQRVLNVDLGFVANGADEGNVHDPARSKTTSG
jgi:hypothetical protein